LPANRPATPPATAPAASSGQLADAPEAAPKAPAAPPDQDLNGEQRQALEQWLRQIPDHPSELLRRKFWYEQQQRQDKPQ
jgi:Ca-activated chloride channel family protein